MVTVGNFINASLSVRSNSINIDTCLDSYATDSIGQGNSSRWWWNGCDVLSDAIESLARHVRVDGCHELTDAETQQLKTLERYMAAYPDFDNITVENQIWFHAEAMWLLGQWFSRLWD